MKQHTLTKIDLSKLGIGVLTWNTPATLANTLHSYHSSGLLTLVGQKILFLQENNPLERSIGDHYGFTILHDAENIGIGNAYRRILDQVHTEFFLYLENDFVCIEPQKNVVHRLETGMRYLNEGKADCVAYRHRRKPGYPNYAYSFIGKEDAMNGVIYSFHWLEEPEKRFPKDITRLMDGAGEAWFLGTSHNGRAANYTNNPALYKTAFIRQVLNNEVSGQLSEEYQDIISQWERNRGAPAQSCFLEPNIVTEWRKHDYRIMMGTGLFSHLPLPEDRLGGRSDILSLQAWIRQIRILPADRGKLPKQDTHIPSTPSAHAENRLTTEQKAFIELLLEHIFVQTKDLHTTQNIANSNWILSIPNSPSELLQDMETVLHNQPAYAFAVVLPIMAKEDTAAIAQRLGKLIPLYVCDILTPEQVRNILGESDHTRLAAALRRDFAIYLNGYGR